MLRNGKVPAGVKGFLERLLQHKKFCLQHIAVKEKTACRYTVYTGLKCIRYLIYQIYMEIT